jgi:tRNA-specific 2-thiouridylase
MMYMMNVHKAEYIATGHYASVVKLDNGRYTVKMADHLSKDQTYMLYKLTQEQLQKTLMPLGGYSKEEVRRIASSIGLSLADKPDSQEICFVSDDDHARFINENYEGMIPGEGNFVDEDGLVLGRHKGIIHYTVGQRKGLGLPLGYPAYVKEIKTDTNEVIIGRAESLLSNTVICRDVNFMGIPGIGRGETIRCRAKIRYHHAPQECNAEVTDSDELKLTFDQPVRAAAPGQSAVMYDEDGCVLAGGIILGVR